ncbi:hypothetical protein CDAR_209501 [Caerostris darwini]|uniref:Uncharacterized protein n=1 Tax=Caerostris darwini TaxID=1538125 RepID=A0AAV4SZ74_9ARAC|nr:hypothetical protein CDAR_209501 [Caerostris darwini]
MQSVENKKGAVKKVESELCSRKNVRLGHGIVTQDHKLLDLADSNDRRTIVEKELTKRKENGIPLMPSSMQKLEFQLSSIVFEKGIKESHCARISKAQKNGI